MEELFSVSEVSAKWKPKGNILDYDPYFVDWIDNINKGGDRMYEYRPFVAYIKQATSWIADKYQFDDYKQDAVMAKRWLEREKLRLQTNSLYYLNKYHYIMEGDVSGGFMKYKAYRAQQIIAFLFDCGYSVIFGKGRQVFFTTTMGGIVLNRVNSRDNYKCIYIADEKKKAEVLFKEKIRWPHKKLPTYLQHTPTSQRDQVFALNNDSYVEVLAAKDTSATGYAANFVALDEIGLNANLSGIISEIRPTLLMYNPQTSRLELRRQVFAWGTGGQMDKGGAAMEMEWNAAKEKWANKDYEYGIIPVYFNVFWREGMTREVYDLEKKRAYAKKGPKRDAIIRQFHQHNPITERDMFIRGNNTLVSEAQIQTHLDRIRNMKDRPQRGFMEPILLGDKISGVNFIPANDSDASPIIILKHPEKGWKHRYYKGTDPVNSSTGASKMASTVWDSHENSIPAILNYKEKNYDYIYEQSMLLNIYYDKPKELIEINAGEAYVKYLNDHNMGHVIVGNKALPKHLQSNTMVGIHNIGKANRYIVNEIMHMLESYADNLNMEIFWEQMSRFVEKQKPSGETKWEAEDKRYYQDDTIFSTVFAYLCSLCYGKYTPREIKGDESAMVKRKFYLDENFNMRPGYFKGNKLIRDGIPNGKR